MGPLNPCENRLNIHLSCQLSVADGAADSEVSSKPLHDSAAAMGGTAELKPEPRAAGVRFGTVFLDRGQSARGVEVVDGA